MYNIKISKQEVEEIGKIEVSRVVFLEKNKMLEVFENNFSANTVANIIKHDPKFERDYSNVYGRFPCNNYFMVTKTKEGFHFDFNNINVSLYQYNGVNININNFMFVLQKQTHQFSKFFNGIICREIEHPEEVDSHFRYSKVRINFGSDSLNELFHALNSLKKGVDYLDSHRGQFNLARGVISGGKPYYKTMFVY